MGKEAAKKTAFSDLKTNQNIFNTPQQPSKSSNNKPPFGGSAFAVSAFKSTSKVMPPHNPMAGLTPLHVPQLHGRPVAVTKPKPALRFVFEDDDCNEYYHGVPLQPIDHHEVWAKRWVLSDEQIERLCSMENLPDERVILPPPTFDDDDDDLLPEVVPELEWPELDDSPMPELNMSFDMSADSSGFNY